MTAAFATTAYRPTRLRTPQETTEICRDGPGRSRQSTFAWLRRMKLRDDNRGENGWTGPHRNRKRGNGNGLELRKKSFQTFQSFQSALPRFRRMCQDPSMRQVSGDIEAMVSTALQRRVGGEGNRYFGGGGQKAGGRKRQRSFAFDGLTMTAGGSRAIVREPVW